MGGGGRHLGEGQSGLHLLDWGGYPCWLHYPQSPMVTVAGHCQRPWSFVLLFCATAVWEAAAPALDDERSGSIALAGAEPRSGPCRWY